MVVSERARDHWVRRDRVRLMSARVTAVCCGSGLVCVCQLVVLCAVDLVCRVDVDWWLRTVDLVCLAWASSGGAASCCMGLVRGC